MRERAQEQQHGLENVSKFGFHYHLSFEKFLNSAAKFTNMNKFQLSLRLWRTLSAKVNHTCERNSCRLKKCQVDLHRLLKLLITSQSLKCFWGGLHWEWFGESLNLVATKASYSANWLMGSVSEVLEQSTSFLIQHFKAQFYLHQNLKFAYFCYWT